MLWLMVLYFIKVLVREQTKSELERAYRGQGHALFWNRLYIHFGNRDRRDGVTKLVPTVSTVYCGRSLALTRARRLCWACL